MKPKRTKLSTRSRTTWRFRSCQWRQFQTFAKKSWIHKKILLEVKNGFTNFAEGDIIFAKITPCMENGKAALIGGW